MRRRGSASGVRGIQRLVGRVKSSVWQVRVLGSNDVGFAGRSSRKEGAVITAAVTQSAQCGAFLRPRSPASPQRPRSNIDRVAVAAASEEIPPTAFCGIRFKRAGQATTYRPFTCEAPQKGRRRQPR
jgi:hypothetical protein